MRMRKLATLALTLAAAGVARAQSSEEPRTQPELGKPSTYAPASPSKDYARIAFNFYEQIDGGGNRRIEERMQILEPMLMINKALGERWTGVLKLQGDVITAASNDGTTDSQSGTFLGGEGSAFYAWSDQTKIGGGVSYSSEADYVSRGAFVKWTQEDDARTNTFSVRLGGFHDSVNVNRFDGTSLGEQTRDSFALGLGWSRVLGPRTVGSLNWDITTQRGYLATAINSVLIGALEVPEALPDSRLRNSLFLRVRHLLWDDFAIEPGVGLYVDDWGATALHIELAAYWEVIPNGLILRPTYRFHLQTAVDAFIGDGAGAVPALRTQDADLGSFTSHTLGLKAILPSARFFGSGELELGVEVTLRSDGLDAVSATFGYQWRF
jgi:hypothetical protein